MKLRRPRRRWRTSAAPFAAAEGGGAGGIVSCDLLRRQWLWRYRSFGGSGSGCNARRQSQLRPASKVSAIVVQHFRRQQLWRRISFCDSSSGCNAGRQQLRWRSRFGGSGSGCAAVSAAAALAVQHFRRQRQHGVVTEAMAFRRSCYGGHENFGGDFC